jgi:D-alanine-D-alanine ligase
MKIGLTYDLRTDYLKLGYGLEETAEFDREETIDSIEKAIQANGHETERIGNIFALTERLARKNRWELVFNVAEGLHGYGREAQIPGLFEAYSIPYTFSDPLVLSLTLHKELTKKVVRTFGIPTPDSALVACEADIDNVRLQFPLFAKPVAEGTSKGITGKSKVDTVIELKTVCIRLLDEFKQPIIIERFLPGREFTVGVIGNGADARPIGTLEVLPREGAEPNACSYWNKENCEKVINYAAPTDAMALEAQHLALAVHACLNCKDSCRVDVRADEHGTVQFIEVNPLAGLHPTHSDMCILATLVGMSYNDLIGKILAASIKRWKLA